MAEQEQAASQVMKFIGLTGLRGETIWINPEFVVAIRPTIEVVDPDAARTKVATTDGASYEVQETQDQVKKIVLEANP